MNTIALICREIAQKNNISQRELSQKLEFSLGKTNKLIKEAMLSGFIKTSNAFYELTPMGLDYLEQFRVDNAIILAAGFGSRFVPLTYEIPKGLLKVNGKPMIERQIEQLIESGIKEIVIVVGYLKEKFDYLVDKYGVTLVYNSEYAKKNNFVSLYYALQYLKRSYILMADNWIEKNIFNAYEPDSWFSCVYFKGITNEWGICEGVKKQIIKITVGGENTWALMGPAFLNKESSKKIADLTKLYYKKLGTDNYYWEDIVRENIKQLTIYANKQRKEDVLEFESLEDLRKYDASYIKNTGNKVMGIISNVFEVSENKISDIKPLKDGMTNQSFIFSVAQNFYVFRLPGAGTDKLIDRTSEKRNYELIKPLGISDEVLYFDNATGIKISKYYKDARITNVNNNNDVRNVMRLLHSFHNAKLTHGHPFNIADKINFYEKLAIEKHAIRFSDYSYVREKVNELLAYKNKIAIPETLCHIDYIHTNILHMPDGSIKIIDWEYSGKSDPIIDIAMFSIYAYYDREKMDRALYYYLGREPQKEESARLYMYIALGGFLWSVWCEYKQSFGEEFGEYPLIMYRYMKDYYNILKNEGFL